ncbi:MAG TPA: flagellar hook-basal body protein [Tepidisphaeraceae bacterium]|nr:flagellar hook-basal body protein [Tepidisphaeraceae bacterium]
MIYGLYLSASGVLTNSYRQDVIANNIANAETVGFKRDLALFQERLTEAQHRRFRGGMGGQSNDLLEKLGGGMFASPTSIDTTSGELEPTGGNLDLAIEGNAGYFMVQDHEGAARLTRNGSFLVDDSGHLILAHSGDKVLDRNRKPILLNGALQAQTEVTRDGQITQAGTPAARIGLFDVPDPKQLTKRGQMLLDHPEVSTLAASNAQLRSGAVERANVDPTTELALLMDAQRQLEANANMIRYQDATLGKLVNEVGKI